MDRGDECDEDQMWSRKITMQMEWREKLQGKWWNIALVWLADAAERRMHEKH